MNISLHFCHSLTFSSFFPNMSIYTISFRCILHYFLFIFLLSLLILSLYLISFICIFLCYLLQHTFLFHGLHIFFFKIFSFFCVHFFFLHLRFLHLQTFLRIFHSSPPASSCLLFLFFIDNRTSFTALFTLHPSIQTSFLF